MRFFYLSKQNFLFLKAGRFQERKRGIRRDGRETALARRYTR